MSDDVKTWKMIHDERARSADMLESLSPEQWTADTLCQGWNVHVVAAHMMIAGEQTTGRFFKGLLASGFRFNVMMDRAARDGARLPTSEIIARIRARTTTTNKPPAAAMAMLGEVVVHGTDIRQPLAYRTTRRATPSWPVSTCSRPPTFRSRRKRPLPDFDSARPMLIVPRQWPGGRGSDGRSLDGDGHPTTHGFIEWRRRRHTARSPH